MNRGTQRFSGREMTVYNIILVAIVFQIRRKCYTMPTEP